MFGIINLVLLTYHIDNNNLKKANLLSFWFEDFAKYNLAEETFNPRLLKKYKRFIFRYSNGDSINIYKRE